MPTGTKKAGRPKLKPSERKTMVVFARVTEDEYEAIVANATKYKMNVSAYLRMLIATRGT